MPEVIQGLAKAAPLPAQDISSDPGTPTTPPSAPSVLYEGVPIEMYRYFNRDMATLPEREREQLKDIYSIAKETSNSTDVLNVMRQINDWELKLGAPNITETRHSKMWNYVTLQRNINRMRKQQELLERQHGYRSF